MAEFKDRFAPGELDEARRIIFESEPWGDEELEKATRGWVVGACNDPWQVGLKVWVGMARREKEFDHSQRSLWEVVNGGEKAVGGLALSSRPATAREKERFGLE